jgi:hypothetical protein
VKSIRFAPFALPLALLAGCGALTNDSTEAGSYETISATVDAYDPDGLLFDLVTNTREFDPGTAGRGPLARVLVTAPSHLAGRKYMIALPEAPAVDTGRTSEELRNKGAKVVFDLPKSLLSRAQHEIIEYTDLRWTDRKVEPGSPSRNGSS